MVEDPSLETVDTYSDWEYYSDDYYDDDPTVIKRNKTNGEHRVKRRKLAANHEIPKLSLGSPIVEPSIVMENSFKGVLWRASADSTDDKKLELYEPGKGEEVALLSNWRDLFSGPLYEKGWNTDKLKDTTTAQNITEDTSKNYDNDRQVTYSPPPDTIEDLDKTIIRQRQKSLQADLQDAVAMAPNGIVAVADNADENEEYEEFDEEMLDLSPTVAQASGNDADNADNADNEDTIIPDMENKILPQTSIRVEVPTLAVAMKQDLSSQKSTPRKRGRKPKATPATTELTSLKGKGTTRGMKNNKTKKTEAEAAVAAQPRRQSRQKPPPTADSEKQTRKRTRARSLSPVSPRMKERGKRRKL